MTAQQAQVAGFDPHLAATNSPAAKKKPSWARTILWMISMVFLSNVVMAIIAYFLFFYNK